MRPGESPEDFEVIDESVRLRFVLSRSAKDSQPVLLPLLLLGVFGLLFSVPMIVTIHSIVTGLFLTEPGEGVWVAWILSPVSPLAVWLAVLVIHQARGTDELILSPRSLQAIRRVGPIRWSRNFRLGQIGQFTVVRQSDSGSDDPRAVYHSLRIELANGLAPDLVSRYPRTLLLDLARELSARSKRFQEDLDDQFDFIGKRRIREDSLIPTEIYDRLERPNGSLITLENKGGNRIFSFPSSSFYNPVLMLVAIVAGGIAIVALVIAGLGVSGVLEGLEVVGLFCIIIGLIGNSLTGLILSLVCRSWELTVTPATLILLERSLFSKRRREWKLDEIEALGVWTNLRTTSDGDVAYRTTLRLICHPKRQTRLGRWEPNPNDLLVGTSKAELEWIATTVRQIFVVASI